MTGEAANIVLNRLAAAKAYEPAHRKQSGSRIMEAQGSRRAEHHSTILSKSLRLARRAGEKITNSILQVSTKQAAKMAMLHRMTRGCVGGEGEASERWG